MFDITDVKQHWFSHVQFLIKIYDIASGDWKYSAWNTYYMDYLMRFLYFYDNFGSVNRHLFSLYDMRSMDTLQNISFYILENHGHNLSQLKQGNSRHQ